MSAEPAPPAPPATAAARQARWDELVARVNESYRIQQRAISEMLRELADVSAVVTARAVDRPSASMQEAAALSSR